MLKKIVIILALCLLFVPQALAADHANNKFGIHLAVADNGDIEKAAQLVNSTGGDWGYVTLVIQENDRDKGKWQNVMDKLRELHLIPIIRLATKPEGPEWRRAHPEDAADWVNFLNSLNWVVKDRYVILFNETNHGQEWGGSVDAADYAKVAKAFAQKLHDSNPDYVVMLAGMDASAPSSGSIMEDEASYLRTVVDTIGKDDFNKLFNALSSHSYPNPGFVGSPYGNGRGSVRTYEWEESLLTSWGVKPMPVYITETGWDATGLSRSTVASYLQQAYQSVWLPDDTVKAVTPFVLNYQGQPFLGFSWRMEDSDDYYPQFDAVQAMEKQSGEPAIEESGSVTYGFPEKYVVDSDYHEQVLLKNTGQAIWNDSDGYHLTLDGFPQGSYYFSNIQELKPFQTEEVDVFFKTGSKPIKQSAKVVLYKGDQKVIEGNTWNYEVVPLPQLNFSVSLYPKLKHNGNDFEIQIFDSREQLVYKKKNIEVEHTKGSAIEIRNIALGQKYRVVILKPYYLPRQTYVVFKQQTNTAVFERMWPVDFNKDGKFDFADIGALIQHPNLISLLLP